MSDKSGIEWTDATWNPVTGCTKVSPGCAHCYAEAVTLRFRRGPAFLPGVGEIVLHPDRLDQPLRWKRPRKIFVNSMSDLFHEDIPDDFISEVFWVMGRAERHTFQVLTKRPERALEWFTSSNANLNGGLVSRAERKRTTWAEQNRTTERHVVKHQGPGGVRARFRQLPEVGWTSCCA